MFKLKKPVGHRIIYWWFSEPSSFKLQSVVLITRLVKKDATNFMRSSIKWNLIVGRYKNIFKFCGIFSWAQFFFEWYLCFLFQSYQIYVLISQNNLKRETRNEKNVRIFKTRVKQILWKSFLKILKQLKNNKNLLLFFPA